MTTETPPAPPETDNNIEVEPLAIGVHHRASFEQAHSHLEKTYGKSPPPDDLMRLWLACATPWDITREFEESVLNIAGSDLVPDDNGHYAQSLLNL
ncbi:hypothetical protein [Ereboglobus luteus]|uniref:Uncharacterized protein n=1 Tax=Ereboglobus luteus TaxID=1796921 RepID=A0A2U8E0H5_9BACT|nr:hypothetical protein [Ereboglobus luteus]AWI08311.1 hypothetical protein CKA38_02720 [Ereboglobus luteus]